MSLKISHHEVDRGVVKLSVAEANAGDSRRGSSNSEGVKVPERTRIGRSRSGDGRSCGRCLQDELLIGLAESGGSEKEAEENC